MASGCRDIRQSVRKWRKTGNLAMYEYPHEIIFAHGKPHMHVFGLGRTFRKSLEASEAIFSRDAIGQKPPISANNANIEPENTPMKVIPTQASNVSLESPSKAAQGSH